MIVCKYCQTERDESQFYKTNRSRCKSCLVKYTKHYMAEFRRLHPSQARERERRKRRKAMLNPQYAAKRREYYRQWYRLNGRQRAADYKEAIFDWQLRNPEKVSAHHAVYSAVKAGKLITPDICTYCGKTQSLYAHHYDYSKPLDVIWLCASCHKRLHAGSITLT